MSENLHERPEPFVGAVLALPGSAGAEGSRLQAAEARGHQTDHGGREGFDFLSAAASRLPAVTQLSSSSSLWL